VTERRLARDLVARFSRLTWTTLSGYAVVVIAAFAILGEVSLGRTLSQTAAVIESLIGLYADPEGERMTVASDSLADQLVGMGARFIITRTAPTAEGEPSVFFLSPTMPAKRIEALGPEATPEEVNAEIVRAVAERGRWRYRVLHRRAGEFDVFVAGSRQPHVIGLAGVAGVALLLLPMAALAARRATRRSVATALAPVERVRSQTQAIGPDDLSRRVAAPTGVIEISQIAEAINRLIGRVETSHRALEAFTADASHELRTPLTYLRAQAQWAVDERRTPDEVRDALTAIGTEVERTSKLVDDLLLLARSDNRALDIERKSFDLSAIACEAAEIAEAMATGRDLAIRNEIQAPARALGDPHYTRQVVLNIVTNAVRHTEQGLVTIALHRGDNMVGIIVRDTGDGIPADDQPHIFDRFYRVEKSRSREHGGVGLGLAIARMLTEVQGGTISLESGVGEGSVFTVSLPAAQSDRVDEDESV
jgi:signal transduction histidine kinase